MSTCLTEAKLRDFSPVIRFPQPLWSHSVTMEVVRLSLGDDVTPYGSREQVVWGDTKSQCVQEPIDWHMHNRNWYCIIEMSEADFLLLKLVCMHVHTLLTLSGLV